MLDVYEAVFEMIDMRSFSNLWYWIALAVLWSTTSHWVIGVPYDLVVRAARVGGEAEDDLEAIVRVNVNRLLYIAGVAGIWLIGGICFFLSVLVTLGFYYDVEFAQAAFLLLFPMAVVFYMSVRAARKIRETGAHGAQLRRMISRHRFWVQVVGLMSIFVTGLWGTYQNLSIGALGG